MDTTTTFTFYEIDEDGEPISDETSFTIPGHLDDPVDRFGIYAALEGIVGSTIDEDAEWNDSRNVVVRDGRTFNLWEA